MMNLVYLLIGVAIGSGAAALVAFYMLRSQRRLNESELEKQSEIAAAKLQNAQDLLSSQKEQGESH